MNIKNILDEIYECTRKGIIESYIKNIIFYGSVILLIFFVVFGISHAKDNLIKDFTKNKKIICINYINGNINGAIISNKTHFYFKEEKLFIPLNNKPFFTFQINNCYVMEKENAKKKENQTK